MKAVSQGTTKIIATLKSNSSIWAEADRSTVEGAIPKTLHGHARHAPGRIGKPPACRHGNDVRRDDQLVTSGSTWASSNTAVATVSPKGVVRGVRVGAASITATYKDTPSAVTVSGSTTVTVLSGPPQKPGSPLQQGPVEAG